VIIRQQYLDGKPRTRFNHEVDQFIGVKYDLSYNPDDDRFYVTNKENDTLGTFKRFTSATYFFKKLEGLICKTEKEVNSSGT